MDAFQLKASYNGLNDALQAWRTEIALIQLGNEPTSVVAVAGLSEHGQLQHFSESGVKLSVEEFKKRKNALLQMLYLARGAARYENDPAVANDYIEKAKVEAEGARDELGTIAKALGVELKREREQCCCCWDGGGPDCLHAKDARSGRVYAVNFKKIIVVLSLVYARSLATPPGAAAPAWSRRGLLRLLLEGRVDGRIARHATASTSAAKEREPWRADRAREAHLQHRDGEDERAQSSTGHNASHEWQSRGGGGGGAVAVPLPTFASSLPRAAQSRSTSIAFEARKLAATHDPSATAGLEPVNRHPTKTPPHTIPIVISVST